MNRPTKLRLMTLNMAHGRGLSTYQGFHSAKGIERNLDRIAALLLRASPDIVALQEVDEDSHWNRRIHLLDCLKAKAGFSHSELGINNRRSGRKHLSYGNGVLSQHTIEHSDTQVFGQATLGEKGFLYSEIAVAGGHLPLVNLHLDFRSKKRRIRQVETLIEYLEARHSAKGGEHYFSPIVLGDFNTHMAKRNDAVEHLFDYLQGHCDYQLYPKQGKTFPSYFPLHALDFIYVPPSYRVRRCCVLKAYVSDHRPVLIDLEIVD